MSQTSSAMALCALACILTGLIDPGRSAGPALSTPGVAVHAAEALYADIREFTLGNGLRVYFKPIPSSPIVTLMVAYKVGSADENLDHTGLSHYLEHLMFKGTNRIMPGDIDKFTLRNGGQNNAATSEDSTIYYFDFAADRWERALEIEADRMQNLRIDHRHEFEQEKGAVIQELQRDEDEPWDLEQKAILPLLFSKASPYGHPVIGERDHVRGATAAIIKAHYDRWYHPNNAALIVCGGFDPDRTLERIKALFGPIPKAELPPRKMAASVKRDKPIEKTMSSRFDVPRMLMGFNTVRSAEPDFYTLDVIDALLSTGKTSRLYRKLVEGSAIAGQIGSSNNAGRYPGWFSIQVQLLKGQDRRQAEKLVLAELKRLRDESVSEAELKRVQTNLVAGFIFSQDSVHNLADTIAHGVTTNNLAFLKSYLPRIAAISASDIQAVARKYFDPESRVVVWSVPSDAAGQGALPQSGGANKRSSLLPASRRKRDQSAFLSTPGGGGLASFSLKKVRRAVLPNGMIVLLFEDHRLPIFVAQSFVRDVRLAEPADQAGVAQLVGRLLDEGTDRHSGPEIAELIEDVGGNLTFGTEGGSVRTLGPDRHLGLTLLCECLQRANFSREAFDRERARLLSEIDDAQKEPDAKAAMVFSAMVYGRHPYGRPVLGTHATVAKLTPEDCRRFHREIYVPNNMVLAVVGDFESAAVIDELTRLMATWQPAKVAIPPVPPVTKPTKFVERIITMPSASQLHFFMGHVGIRRGNADYYKLKVMDYVLGTGPGFTDRLSSRLRDREGLAYTVNATITPSATEQPGTFTCYIGTDPENFARVKATFLQELNRIRHEAPTQREVDDAKRYLLGSLPFEFASDSDIAAKLLTIERFHLGFDYVSDYRQAVSSVTPEEVRAVAAKYLDPDHMILVAAGALNAQGKPLRK